MAGYLQREAITTAAAALRGVLGDPPLPRPHYVKASKSATLNQRIRSDLESRILSGEWRRASGFHTSTS